MDRQKLVEMKSNHFACVYRLWFPNGKVYVGKSKDIGKRVDVYERKTSGRWADSSTGTALYGAIRMYGLESVECEVLFRISGASGVDWEKDLDYALGIVEMRWIKESRSNEKDYGYNSTEGGEMFGVKNMERVKEVEVEKQRIVWKDVVVERERQTNGVPVVGYDVNGNYIGEWPSRVAFSREVLGITKTADYGVWKNGYIMYEKGEKVEETVESYDEYLTRINAAREKAEEIRGGRLESLIGEGFPKSQRGVVMCRKDYSEVTRFDSMKEAAEQTGILYSSIYAVVRKGYGCAKGFHFYWTDEWEENGCKPPQRAFEAAERKKENRTNNKKSTLGRIIQLDRKYEVVATYDDINAAIEATGLRYSSIYAAAKKGGDAFAGLYHWRFEDAVVEGADKESDEAEETSENSTDGLLGVDW